MPRPKTNYVTSLKAASKRLGIDLELLRDARDAGADGFHGSRVNLDEVKAWLSANPELTNADKPTDDKSLRELRAQLLRQQILKAIEVTRASRLANEATEGNTIRIDAAKATITALLSEDDATVRVMIDTLPLQLQGLGIPEMRVILVKAFDERREKMRSGAMKITEV